MRSSLFAACLAAPFILGTAAPAGAVILLPTGITVNDPDGGVPVVLNDVDDDLLLESLSFGDAVFADGSSFSAARAFEVTLSRLNINAEWGDADSDADGDANPFVKAGHDPSLQETTEPFIQDATLLQAFNSRSLSEMIDGETGGFQFKMLFANGLTDDDDAPDIVPELIFFERGMNDAFDVELILGGTFDAPLFSAACNIASEDFWDTGLGIDTTEIRGPQKLGAGGLDFDVFDIDDGAVVYGMRVTVTSGGPDLSGFFLSTVDPARFTPALGEAPGLPPLAEAPLPPAAAGLLAGLAALGWASRRRRA